MGNRVCCRSRSNGDNGTGNRLRQRQKQSPLLTPRRQSPRQPRKKQGGIVLQKPNIELGAVLRFKGCRCSA